GNRSPSAAKGPDGTLELHSCPGGLREVEALKDRLLALFEEDPTLRPGDAAVLCPDLEVYASLVEAVFGGEPGRPGSIPFQLGERNYRGESPLGEHFSRLLEILPGRIPASRGADLLEYPPLAERFGLGPEEVEQARLWIRESGIRWGEDEEHRAREGLPSFRENSWRWGLDRLLLGYAAPAEGKSLYGGVLPFDDVEGTAAAVLGGLCSFFSALREARAALEEPRLPGEWAAFYSELLEKFFSPSGVDSADAAWMRGLLQSMGEEAAAAGFEKKIDFLVFQEAFSFRLGEAVRRHSFLAGGVHFASLLPMRGLPFRVICLLGMNDGDFPRSETPAPFDRIARNPRPGDRSKREDDRSLFLETIAAARERLLIFWGGRSEREGSPLPPSVAVSELLDVLEESLPGGREGLVRDHPLQPFSPRYFVEGSEIRGLQGPWLQAARIVSGPRRERRPFLEGAVDVEEESQVSLERLVSFFKDPAGFFLRESLGLYLRKERDVAEDREPLSLRGLENYKIGDEL
ncbi:MAG TPA: exonuclease V subunit gamma, partial [Planctomycetes bacterium]|nr:exonuclease V subunit gamma [Planctomycetota bacterium]